MIKKQDASTARIDQEKASPSDFKDQFSYLATFLTVIIGLAIFKDEATRNNVAIFGGYPSYFDLAIPLLVSVFLATYTGALTMMVSHWRITAIPLGKIFEVISYVLASAGLVYPLLLGVTLAVYYAIEAAMPRMNIVNSIMLPITILQVIVFAKLSIDYAFRREESVTRERAAMLYDDFIDRPDNENPITQYEDVVTRLRAYLQLRGYGVARQPLSRMAEIMASKKLFDKQDLELAKKANGLRNKYVHASPDTTAADVRILQNSLVQLGKKIDTLLLEVFDDEEAYGSWKKYSRR